MCGRLVQSGVAAIVMSELHDWCILSFGFVGGIVMPGGNVQRCFRQDCPQRLFDLSGYQHDGLGHILRGRVGREHYFVSSGIILSNARVAGAMSEGFVLPTRVQCPHQLPSRSVCRSGSGNVLGNVRCR
jgi:hypothetical protein